MLACQWPRWHGALPRDVVRGALAISGLYDLEPFIVTPFLRGDLRLDDGRALAMSPASLAPATPADLRVMAEHMPPRLAAAVPGSDQRATALLGGAQAALGRAKDNGRNRVCIHEMAAGTPTEAWAATESLE